MKNARAIACDIIYSVIKAQSSLITLDQDVARFKLNDQDRRLIYAIGFGVFRHYFFLNHVLANVVQKKPKPKLYCLLLIGGYQLLYMRKPNHAVINETVSACSELKLQAYQKFVNAILRKIATTKEAILTQSESFVDLPNWLSNQLAQHYRHKFQALSENSNKHAPMFIRLNRQKNPQAVLESLAQRKIDYTTTSQPYCLKLTDAIDVGNDPVFQRGFYSVQDISAQYAATIISPKNGETILDACAAPGGKTTHLLEIAPKCHLTAVDSHATRLTLIRENLKRLNQDNLNIQLIHGDASQDNDKLTVSFDKILVDAPCSATGVIRRHPDIKVLRHAKDVDAIAVTQRQILSHLWQYLKPGGQLLYATCSILPQENNEQIQAFIEKQTDALVVDIALLAPYATDIGYQILPGDENGDGFYYCLLQKATKPTAESAS
ncbi:MAG: 16S rRNA (cytosine(967)-C(5))-methyltransferase RsmB [Francisellaceae bacterium]